MTLVQHHDDLIATAAAIALPGKGLLAADESTPTIGKRLAGVGVENNEAMRRAYRSLLVTTDGLADFISGVILYEETLFQDADDGLPMVEHLQKRGLIPGIKVDMGVQPLAGGCAGETWCTGLAGLQDRAARYYARGARFAKWRAVLRISEAGAPSELAIRENAWGLARYARTVQEEGLVPIVEPEILMDGDHAIETTAARQEAVLKAVYAALAENGVLLEGSLLKPSMTTAGASHHALQSPRQVGRITVQTLKRAVPAAVPGILFLSGGLGEEEASVYLDAINREGRRSPWHLGFSYGRALQQSCLKHWHGSDVAAGQAALLARARANSEASLGAYQPGSQPSDGDSLFVAGYSY
ncbi:fructose-bisphosphate aldolase class I [Synechococcus sp. RSCCF101]|uniref:class I fructose-bisphosphate aldolase n=1 Tax=Synechococcus sp. RSCCF101 TaxID=2511069 RepID=UPI0012493DD1|nr:class I fructose-bisphosphate aldolase [Synechococcus sp. RSCCF101]QEY33006.1 fructose-bisphosphate aldolase class I [Synechococcus sp. RSCCF101]